MRYYIIVLAGIESGGPELAHQMCRELMDLGKEAYMYYIVNNVNVIEPFDREACEKYKKYNTRHVTDISEVESEESIVIFPEVYTILIPFFKKCKKVLWWMSVDNYTNQTHKGNLDMIRQEIELHIVQSQYAYQYVKNKVSGDRKILYVSDYIGEKYMMEIGEGIVPRQNIALYNPAKGLDKILPLIEKTPWLKWIKLCNLSEEDMIAYMHISKIYVDFGNHPGKDRIPREAAICGCCVVTNKDGSAAYYEDVPIPEQYKFDNVAKQYDEVALLLKDICERFEYHRAYFEDYRAFIRAERSKFSADVESMINYIKSDML
jgi:hypothetical protein